MGGWRATMRVKILREPDGPIAETSLKHYRQGQVYDLPPQLAQYLVIEDLAIVEMREKDNAQEPVAVERRKK
jgi:hypothetical protein